MSPHAPAAAGKIAEDPAACAEIVREVGAIQQLILMALSENEVVVEQACKTIAARHPVRQDLALGAWMPSHSTEWRKRVSCVQLSTRARCARHQLDLHSYWKSRTSVQGLLVIEKQCRDTVSSTRSAEAGARAATCCVRRPAGLLGRHNSLTSLEIIEGDVLSAMLRLIASTKHKSQLAGLQARPQARRRLLCLLLSTMHACCVWQ